MNSRPFSMSERCRTPSLTTAEHVGVAQLEEQRSPKPQVAGSSPATLANPPPHLSGRGRKLKITQWMRLAPRHQPWGTMSPTLTAAEPLLYASSTGRQGGRHHLGGSRRGRSDLTVNQALTPRWFESNTAHNGALRSTSTTIEPRQGYSMARVSIAQLVEQCVVCAKAAGSNPVGDAKW
jgi:hypothetical protein